MTNIDNSIEPIFSGHIASSLDYMLKELPFNSATQWNLHAFEEDFNHVIWDYFQMTDIAILPGSYDSQLIPRFMGIIESPNDYLGCDYDDYHIIYFATEYHHQHKFDRLGEMYFAFSDVN